MRTSGRGHSRRPKTNGHFYKPAAWANFAPAVLAVHWVRVPCLPNPSARTLPARDGFEKSHFRELLKTYCVGESVSSGARRTLGTCPLLTANFTRSRRFLEILKTTKPNRGGHFRPFLPEDSRAYWGLLIRELL